MIEEIRRRDQFDEEFDINSNETMTYTDELEKTYWSLPTLGPALRLTEFPRSNAKYTKSSFFIFFVLMFLIFF